MVLCVSRIAVQVSSTTTQTVTAVHHLAPLALDQPLNALHALETLTCDKANACQTAVRVNSPPATFVRAAAHHARLALESIQTAQVALLIHTSRMDHAFPAAETTSSDKTVFA